MNYTYKPEDIYLCHSGKRGMKWGYNDGKSNGKRSARSDKYEKQMANAVMSREYYKQESSSAYSKGDSKKSKVYSKKYADADSEVRKLDKKVKDASGFAYDIGYTAGSFTRSASKQLSKGKKYIGKACKSASSKVSKTASKGKSYLKKLFK